MFPLLTEMDNVIFYGCDFSPRAIQFVKVSNLRSFKPLYIFGHIKCMSVCLPVSNLPAPCINSCMD